MPKVKLKEQPEWAKLVGKWRGQLGRTGLTMPFLCVATGIQPETLLTELKAIKGRVGFCGDIRAPIVYYSVPHCVWLLGETWSEHHERRRKTPTWPPVCGYRNRFSIDQSGLEVVRQFYFYTYMGSGPDIHPEMLVTFTRDVLLEGGESKSYNTSLGTWRKLKPTEIKFIERTLYHPPYTVDGVTEDGDIKYVANWKRAKSSRPVLIP